MQHDNGNRADDFQTTTAIAVAAVVVAIVCYVLIGIARGDARKISDMPTTTEARR